MLKHPLVQAAQSARQQALNGNCLTIPALKALADKVLGEKDVLAQSASIGSVIYAACDSGLVENSKATDLVESLLKKTESLNTDGKLHGEAASASLFAYSIQQKLSVRKADELLYAIGHNEIDLTTDDQLRLNLASHLWNIDTPALASSSRNALQTLVTLPNRQLPSVEMTVPAKQSWMEQPFANHLEESVGSVLHNMEIVFDSGSAHVGVFPITLRSRTQRRVFFLDTPADFYANEPAEMKAWQRWRLRTLSKYGWKVHHIGSQAQWGSIEGERERDMDGKWVQPRLPQAVLGMRKELIQNAMAIESKF